MTNWEGLYINTKLKGDDHFQIYEIDFSNETIQEIVSEDKLSQRNLYLASQTNKTGSFQRSQIYQQALVHYLKSFAANSFCVAYKQTMWAWDMNLASVSYSFLVGFRDKKDGFKFCLRFHQGKKKEIEIWNSELLFTVVTVEGDTFEPNYKRDWNAEDPQGLIT